jgi:hypothetical protein
MRSRIAFLGASSAARLMVRSPAKSGSAGLMSGNGIRTSARRVWVVALALVSAGLVATAASFSTEPARAISVLTFNIHCKYSHSAKDDPIVFPGQPGASHNHDFFGNKSTNAATTTATLVGVASTCENGWDKFDHSAYWVPTLYKDGKPITDPSRYALNAYYRRDGGTAGPTVKPFPLGLRMIAGDPKATSYDNAQSSLVWYCRNSASTSNGTSLPNCPSGRNIYLEAKILFPSCWNGRDLDSPDHKSHMSYSVGPNRACPASHPVKLPTLDLKISYRNVYGDLTGAYLASGHFGSMHADFFNAWDPAAQSALVNRCLNTANVCQSLSASEVAFTPTSPEQLAKLAASATGAATAPDPHAAHA